MAHTVRNYWVDGPADADGWPTQVLGEHRDGKTGMVVKRRREELAAKRGARQEARRQAWAEAQEEV